MSEENLISLKEAAQISGYTPDYIGQLIRAGKIPGKQVYANITWMTTAEAVLNYKNKNKAADKNVKTDNWLTRQKRKFQIEYEIIKLFFRTFRNTLPILLLGIVLTFILIIYFGFLAIDRTMIPDQTSSSEPPTENFTF